MSNVNSYQLLIDGILDHLLLILDKDGCIVHWNKAVEQLSGYNTSEIEGKSIQLLFPDVDNKNSIGDLLSVVILKTSTIAICNWKKKDGDTICVSVKLSLVYTENIHTGFTLSAHQNAEKTNVETFAENVNQTKPHSEAYFRALTENAADMIILTSIEGEIKYVNPGFEKVTGFDKEGIIGRSFFSIMRQRHAKKSKQVYENLIANPGKPFAWMSRLLDKHRRYIWVEGTVINLLNDKNVESIVCNFHNITERKINEEKLINVKRLYAFLSGINQTIVHSEDEQTLFKDTCRIAVEVGEFKMAWIGLFDEKNQIEIAGDHDVLPKDKKFFVDAANFPEEVRNEVVGNGNKYVTNDIESDEVLAYWHAYAVKRRVSSYMALPLKRAGNTIGIINLFAGETNLFDSEEIRLLDEIARDISFALDVLDKERHRKTMEARLMHSEFRLKQAQAIAHFGNWEIDLVKGGALLSDEACNIYGLETNENELTYLSWQSFTHPDDRADMMDKIEYGQIKNKKIDFLHRVLRKDGMIRYIFSQAEFEFSKDGVPEMLYGVSHDITERKEAEEALMKAQDNLGLIVDLIPQAIFARDVEGTYLFVNKEFTNLYGVSPAEIINKNIDQAYFGKGESEYFARQDNEVLASGIMKTMPDYSFTDKQGNKKLISLIKVPYSPFRTNTKAILGIATDITEQKKAEIERTKMIADMVQRNKDLEQFSYIVSHNLRSPVANIMGITDVLQFEGLTPEDEKTFIDDLLDSVKKLDNVIMDLNHVLQVKNDVSGKRELVHFSQLLNDITVSIDHLIKSEEVQIISDFSAIDEIHTLRSYIYSVFYNLISNSIKYKQANSHPIIHITSRKLENKIILEFSDNGLGIDLNHRGPQVFGLYKRFHLHTEGKGVGLFMVKTQVETLGGTISIESTVNVGTTFTIEFGID